MNDQLSKAIVFVLLAFFLFSSVDATAKWLALAGIPILQVVFLRYFMHLVVSTQRAGFNRFSGYKLPRTEVGPVLLRSLLLVSSTVCNFIALPHLPLTTLATITFSAPIFICLLSMPMLGERVGGWRWAAIVVGFVGVVVAMRPGGGFHWAMLFSLGAALSFALYSIMSRKLVGRTAVPVLQFYSGLVGTLALSVPALLVWVSPSTPLEWALSFTLGLMGWLGHELFSHAHRHAPASALSPFIYILFVYMCFWGWTVFGSVPDTFTLYGAALVIGAGVVIWWRETRVKKQSAETVVP